MENFTILHRLSGVYAPGRICLLLGPPGGGKSTLLKALSGLAPMPVTGDMLYNGHTQTEFNVRRTARYVDQSDLHNPLLTVRETLTFAAACMGPGYSRSMLEHLERKEKELGITPEPEVAELMRGMHRDDDPSSNVALTLQARSAEPLGDFALHCSCCPRPAGGPPPPPCGPSCVSHANRSQQLACVAGRLPHTRFT